MARRSGFHAELRGRGRDDRVLSAGETAEPLGLHVKLGMDASLARADGRVPCDAAS
jgi:hypothetical protein